LFPDAEGADGARLFFPEVGCAQAPRFIEVSGSLDGNAPYRKGERVWFS